MKVDRMKIMVKSWTDEFYEVEQPLSQDLDDIEFILYIDEKMSDEGHQAKTYFRQKIACIPDVDGVFKKIKDNCDDDKLRQLETIVTELNDDEFEVIMRKVQALLRIKR